jgi:hypothetical protein
LNDKSEKIKNQNDNNKDEESDEFEIKKVAVKKTGMAYELKPPETKNSEEDKPKLLE